MRRRRALLAGAAVIAALGTGGAAWTQWPHSGPAAKQVGGPAPVATTPCPVFDNFGDGGVTPTEQARATAMGSSLCSALGGGAKFSQLEEWVSTGGLSGGYTGRVYNLQAHHPEAGGRQPDRAGRDLARGLAGTPSPGAAGVTVSSHEGVLQAMWPDGTTINMEAGKDTPANRSILVNPVFDAFPKG